MGLTLIRSSARAHPLLSDPKTVELLRDSAYDGAMSGAKASRFRLTIDDLDDIAQSVICNLCVYHGLSTNFYMARSMAYIAAEQRARIANGNNPGRTGVTGTYAICRIDRPTDDLCVSPVDSDTRLFLAAVQNALGKLTPREVEHIAEAAMMAGERGVRHSHREQISRARAKLVALLTLEGWP